MLSLRNRFGIPGWIAVIALVFAMVGGAFAASGGLTAKEKKEVKKIAKGLVPAGPQGPIGSAGPQGPKGDKGDPGNPGTAGNSVAAHTFTAEDEENEEPEGEPCELHGGVELTVEGSTESHFACNGGEGSPWTSGGTLPPGATETGAWFTNANRSIASFNIPLAQEVSAAHTIVVAPETTPPAECDDGVAPSAGVAHPEADSGFFCIFEAEGSEGTINTLNTAVGGEGASVGGASISGSELAKGTWAVTG